MKTETRPPETETVTCWTCGESAEVRRYYDPVCVPCQRGITDQLREAVPVLHRYLVAEHMDEVRAAVTRGTFPGAVWFIGRLWEHRRHQRHDGPPPHPYVPSTPLVDDIAREVAAAVATDYRRESDETTERTVSFLLTKFRDDGNSWTDGYAPLLVGDGCHSDPDFEEALGAALRPRVRAWLEAELPDAIRAMDTRWVERQAWDVIQGKEEADTSETTLDAQLDAILLAEECGLSEGAADFLRLVAHLTHKKADNYTDPFGRGSYEDVWHRIVDQLPSLARRYVEAKHKRDYGDE